MFKGSAQCRSPFHFSADKYGSRNFYYVRLPRWLYLNLSLESRRTLLTEFHSPDKYTRLLVDDKEIILIGTAHISQESVDTVVRSIDETIPDTVCVELDFQRYQSLINKQGWESLNLKDLIKKKQLP